jgi:hypothetical protein
MKFEQRQGGALWWGRDGQTTVWHGHPDKTIVRPMGAEALSVAIGHACAQILDPKLQKI